VKFSFIAKHRGIWPAEWLCEALGVSRGGFYLSPMEFERQAGFA